MNTKNNSVSRFWKNFLLFIFLGIAMIILFPKNAQARLIMKTTNDGFTLSGTMTFDPDDDDNLCQGFDYRINTESKTMDYTYELSVTFPSLNLSPESITVEMDDCIYTTLYNNGSNIFSSKGNFNAYDSINSLEMALYYDSYDIPKVNVQVNLTVREKRKQPEIIINFAENHYEGDMDTLTINVHDPYSNFSLDVSRLSISFAEQRIYETYRRE